MKRILGIIILWGIAMLALLESALAGGQILEGEKRSLDFGIVPQQSATKLARFWVPVLTYVGKRASISLNFKTAKDIPTFEERLAEGQYDLGYMNPYHYTVFHTSPGYVAIAKEKDKRIQGIVVVKNDNPIKNISELSGLEMAFPAPAAFAATVLPRAYFFKNKIKVTANYVSSHDSVYRSVAKGIYPAGGGIMRTFSSMDEDVRSQLRILWKTDFYTPHAIAMHPRVAGKTITQIQDALVHMQETPEGRAILEQLSIKGFEPAVDSDWDDVRALGIDLLHNSSDVK